MAFQSAHEGSLVSSLWDYLSCYVVAVAISEASLPSLGSNLKWLTFVTTITNPNPNPNPPHQPHQRFRFSFYVLKSSKMNIGAQRR